MEKEHLYCLCCADAIDSLEENPREVCSECESVGF